MPVRALRVNYVGELGWELHPEMQAMEALYDALWDGGQEYGIANFGLYAVNSLRIEKAYRGWGAELTNEITLVDADMQRFINFGKAGFVGREASLRQQEEGRSIQLIYFEVDADDSDARGAEPIFAGDDCVGITTSGGYGHAVQKSLGFGYVDLANAKPGTELGIDLLGRRCRTTVLKDPVYDPANDRLRA